MSACQAASANYRIQLQGYRIAGMHRFPSVVFLQHAPKPLSSYNLLCMKNILGENHDCASYGLAEGQTIAKIWETAARYYTGCLKLISSEVTPVRVVNLCCDKLCGRWWKCWCIRRRAPLLARLSSLIVSPCSSRREVAAIH